MQAYGNIVKFETARKSCTGIRPSLIADEKEEEEASVRRVTVAFHRIQLYFFLFLLLSLQWQTD